MKFSTFKKNRNTKKTVPAAKKHESIYNVLKKPKMKHGSLRKVLSKIKSKGNNSSDENIVIELNSMDNTDHSSTLLELQRTHGNQYVQKVAKIQTKLKISKSGDIYEQEADSVAEQVMRMPEPKMQRKCPEYKDCPMEDKEKKTKLVQLKTSGQQVQIEGFAQDNLLSNLESGQPLDKETRDYMEPRLGHDFGQVRIHTDSKAAINARLINAKAFTLGSDIVFGQGQYQLKTSNGQRMLAHELTHVMQQDSKYDRIQRQSSQPHSQGVPQWCHSY